MFMLHAIYSVSVTKTKLLVPFRLKILHQTYDVSRVRGQNSELLFTWDILLLYITDNGEIRKANHNYVCNILVCIRINFGFLKAIMK